MKVSIVGITGYSGLELVKLLHQHKHISVVSIHATTHIGRRLSEVYPYLSRICSLVIESFDAYKIMSTSDLVFFATPSGIANQLSKPFVETDFPVIDLSGDHRLSEKMYKKWYKKPSSSQCILNKFTYSLAEFTKVRHKRFISNPGCYATAVELALIPLLKSDVIEENSIIIDSKSGLTGSGKTLSEASHFVNIHDNYVTYKLNHHQHIPEIVQELQLFNPKVKHIQFSTSLLPVNRGIVATSYVKLKKPLDEEELRAIYQEVYKDKPFIRIQPNLPELHNVIGTNFTDIGFRYNHTTNILTVISVIDNLIKGAAGQAVQNLNLMNGWDETEGLLLTPNYL